ncbi:MAG: amylosucrase [Phycisphaerales bacterium]|nr:amylosucrase [Phycisphaerales bacterium]
MPEPTATAVQADATLRRLLPRIEARFAGQIDDVDWANFVARVREHFPVLFDRMFSLYGRLYDFFYHLESVLTAVAQMWMDRPGELKALDALREADPDWYQSHRMIGAMCYVDLFAGDLQGLREQLPYLTELDIRYLHLMPLFKVPQGDSDGGYAVSSYREVNEKLGTMPQLAELASEMRNRGISLVLDFVCNHTSDEHEWAQKAWAGDGEFQDYYRIYPDRTIPDAYERSMIEVFPDDRPGAFTYRSQMKKWVWTTFYNYQCDLNYENPVVFARMLEEMLFLANQGVEVLRLDAVAFLWKEMGTTCQNLPQAHTLIQAFRAAARIAAPAMVFKSEAIVHPDEVRKYISGSECELSYNPQLMAMLWDALATRDVRALQNTMQHRFAIPLDCAWVNYVRCHDDIGWTFADEDVAHIGFDPDAHRRFLTAFYTGKFGGSFARGLPFQEDPVTGKARVSGTCASLCGLEKAIDEQNEADVELAIRRIHLLHGILFTIGGIPLIYLGDEIAMLNRYDYEEDPDKRGDSRWVHRASFDWERAEERRDPETIAGRVYKGILRLSQLRQQNLAFTRAETQIIDTGNVHVFGYFRNHDEHSVLVLASFSEHEQRLDARRLRQMGLLKTVIDLNAGQIITATAELVMEPYQFMVLTRSR